MRVLSFLKKIKENKRKENTVEAWTGFMMIHPEFEHVSVLCSRIWQKSQPSFFYSLCLLEDVVHFSHQKDNVILTIV